MKGSHGQAELKRLYAAEKGIPLRTAQYQAKHGHADWLAFLARMGSAALKVEAPTKPQSDALLAVMRTGAGPGQVQTEQGAVVDFNLAPPAMTIPRHLWTPEQYAECEAWVCLVEANAQRNAALQRGEPMVAIGFVRIASEALKAYHFARQKRVAADIEAGRLKPMAAWQAMKSGLQKIVALLVGLEGELAQAANPDNPLFARKAIGDWKERKWNPAVQSMVEELSLGLVA